MVNWACEMTRNVGYMTTLRSLSEQIEKAIRLHENDVEAVVHPNARGIRDFCYASIDVLIRDIEIWTNVGQLRKLPKSRDCFIETLLSAKNNFDQQNRLSFWHFGVICFTTCFAYEQLIKERKHITIDLNAQSTWNAPNWEVVVLFLNFAAGKLYPDALRILNDIFNQPNVDAKDACRFLLQRIEMLS